jgi:preprotein translocase YajC subunit
LSALELQKDNKERLIGEILVTQGSMTKEDLVMALEIGDIVITAGGLYGKVTAIEEGCIILEVESGAKVKVTKGAVLKKES